MNNIFFKFVLRADAGRTAAQPGLLFCQLVSLFVELSEETLFARIATPTDECDVGETSVLRRLDSLNPLCTKESNLFAIDATKTSRAVNDPPLHVHHQRKRRGTKNA